MALNSKVARLAPFALGLAGVHAAPASLAAQKVPVVQLRPADAKLDEEFTFIGAARELKDGRLILNDPREGRLVVADLRTGKVEQIGRNGQGPGEYAYALPVLALSGDSSIMADLSRRWLLFDGSKIVATLSPDAPAIRATGGYATGADRNGFVIATKRPPNKPGSTTYGSGDSVVVVRAARATGRLDTIARLRQPLGARSNIITDATGKVTRSSVSRPAFAVGEDAVLFNDGWLAIARLDPYRVDWRAPDGKVTRGAPLPVPTVKVDEREKKVYLDRNAKNIADNNAGNLPDDLRADLARSFTEFPAEIPPFQTGALVAAADGLLLIRRTRTADHLEIRFDVVNRRGVLERQLTIADNERIVGFGATSVYVAWKDTDDVERLRRHPWIPARPIVP